MNLVITRPEQVGPVACTTRSDIAPRSAVRRVSPRPDPTRSACVDEPGGTAIRPGNQHWGLSSPSRTANQPNGGEEREERRRKPRLQPVHAWDGRDSESCAAVPVFWVLDAGYWWLGTSLTPACCLLPTAYSFSLPQPLLNSVSAKPAVRALARSAWCSTSASRVIGGTGDPNSSLP